MTSGRSGDFKAMVGSSLCLFMALIPSALDAGVVPLEKQVDTKVLEQIAGNYEFEYQGVAMVFVFTVEDGKLLGSPENETAEVLEPVADKETTFVGYSPDGTEYQFAFKKDADGKYTICVCNIPAMGIEVEGVRVK